MTADSIALIGASCRFPGAPDLDAFASLLTQARDAVGEIPDGRWAKSLYYHPDRGQPGKSYTFAAGVLEQIDQFDPMFFGISPREAVQMDPQQRLLLELTHEAIEDAGLDGSRLTGTNIGVYIGGSSSDYMTLRLGDPSVADAYFMTGSTLCSLANRISYVFDLRGPSFTVDTACSSSLVALHLACEALRRGEVDAAVVGGVNLLLAPQSFVGFSRASMLSPRGRCHAFDARGDGYVRAEGGGVVILKRLRDATAAGHAVRAVIRGTGVNSDGRTTGFSLPNKAAQIALLQDVYARAGVAPDELVYLEAHGTGTAVGDPIEAGAIGTVLGRGRRAPLPIGSVKTNIGHLEPASGMAGLLKVMLALESRVLPASLHNETPNPHIPFAELNLRLLSASCRIAADVARPLAGVNSFGFGGTNAHAIVAAAPVVAAPVATDRVTPAEPATFLPPLLLSARADAALHSLAATWRARLAQMDEAAIPPALRGLARAREQHPLRLVVNGPTPAELREALDEFLAGRACPSVVTGTALQGAATQGGEVVFVFSGNGSQWAGMGAEALHHNAAFADAVRLVDAELTPLLGWSVLAHLSGPPDEDALRQTHIAQPLLFTVQVASVCALRDCGIEAAAHLGHSAGEVAAAWASGALSLPQAARVIAHRSHRQQQTHGHGRMAVLGLSAEAAAAAIADLAGLAIAAVNASNSVTVAGREAGLLELGHRAKARNWVFTHLDLDYAFHSPIMDPIEAGLAEDLAGLAPAAVSTRFVSTVTGDDLAGTELDAGYWWRNVRLPVRFADAVLKLLTDGGKIFLEVGPQPVLQSYLHDALRQTDQPGRVLSTLSRRPAGRDPFLTVAARCHVAGASIADTRRFDGPMTWRDLPAYPWQRERYWTDRSIEATDTITASLDHRLLGYRRGAAPDAWFNHLSVVSEPWLGDHVVDRSVVLPAAAMIDMALAAARQRHPDAPGLQIFDLEIGRPLVLEPERAREVILTVSPGGGFELASRARLGDEPFGVHAAGRLGAAEGHLPDAPMPALPPVTATLTAPALYALASRHGLEYGPEFRAVAHVALAGPADALVSLTIPPLAIPRDRVAEGYLIDPALLDGALQGLVALAAGQLGAAGQIGVMPWRFGRIRLLAPGGARPVQARLRITRAGPRAVCADIVMQDQAGASLAELTECWFVAIPLGRRADPAENRFQIASVASLPLAPVSADLPDPDLLTIALAACPAPVEAEPAGPAALADAYATASAHAAVAAVAGADAAAFDLPGLITDGRLHPDAQTIMQGLLAWLEADGLAVEQLGVWSLAAESGLPPAAPLWRSLLFDAPSGVADTALLGAAGSGLAAGLRGGFAQGDRALPAALLEQMFFASPSGAAAVAALGDALAALAAQWSPDRPLRVLEIGAHKGAGTRRLLGRLAGADLSIRYLATTGDPDDLPSLNEVTASLDGAAARLWCPRQGDALDERFDIILGLYPLSRLRPSREALVALRGLLCPGGIFLVAEPEPNRSWGLIQGAADPDWWVRARARTTMPLREPADWQVLLAEAGFAAHATASIATPSWPVTLLGAQRDTAPEAAAVPQNLSTPVLVLSPPAWPLATALLARLLEGGRLARRRPAANLARVAVEPGPNELVLLLDMTDAGLDAMATRLADLAAAAATLSETPPLRLWLVAHDGTALEAAGIAGLRRVLANEAPNVDCRLLRLDPGMPMEAAAERIAGEILHPDAETEIAWSAAGRRVLRVRRGGAPVAAMPAGARLAVTRPGLLNSLAWQETTPRAPGADEVAISVRAAGLNFRDVMWAMGLLPDEALLHGFAGPTLGLECAGVVTAVGPAVTDLAVGDRVMAFAPASLGSDVVTARHAVSRMPDGLGFADAATIPVAFLTVVYALGTLAQLAPGERVLIHGGAGGVGLAAIQYAKHCGAEVFATAGSPAKRALLRLLGVDHVLDSRSLAFADEVMALTGGDGVDVVLNSLSGEAMERSLRLLRPFGRFLELGKRDLYRNTAVGIRPLRHNVSYFAIDADQLPVSRPRLAAKLLADIEKLFADGALRALPHRVFRFDAAVDAFRLMQAAGHIGKLVLVPGDGRLAVTPAVAPAFLADPEKTYVLTGALDGFGLATARWLGRHGARHLALLSRRGTATPGAAEVRADFARDGIDARAFACDVADEVALADALDRIRAAMPPIGGVVHAAAVLDDALLPQLTEARFAAVLRPKVAGAVLLDRLTRADPVDLFLLFSSVTTALGNPGQANYVAANAMLESVATRRAAAGLPALAVCWGAIGDVGMLARDAAASETLSRRTGAAGMNAADALDALPGLLAAGQPVVGFAELRWGTLRQQLPLLGTKLFAEDGRRRQPRKPSMST